MEATQIQSARAETDLQVGPRLRELEAVVERGKHAFLEVGRALLVIRDERRYKERGFKSFDDYCAEHWGFSRTNANRLIEAAAIAEEVVSIDTTLPAPANVAQTRELAKAPEGERAEVWAEVVEQHEGAPITAVSIRDHVEARKPQPADPVEPDKAEQWFADRTQDHKDAKSELFRIDAAVKPCSKVDWDLLADQIVRMTPLERRSLGTSASILETAARQIRERLETKLEVVK